MATEQRVRGGEAPSETIFRNTQPSRAHHKFTALIIGLVAVATLTTACLPQSASGDPKADGVLTAMNRDRAGNGVPPLRWNTQLSLNAQAYAKTLAARSAGLVHQDLAAILRLPYYAGYNALGENLLVGPGTMTPDTMEGAWMASPAHRANILFGAFSSAGVGYAYGADGRLWIAVEFGG
jgi:uncharacterized protein YkwD